MICVVLFVGPSVKAGKLRRASVCQIRLEELILQVGHTPHVDSTAHDEVTFDYRSHDALGDTVLVCD